jgi:alpha-maltose-1-phosphate synthase
MKILFIQIENTGGIHLYTARLANALSKTQDVHFLLGKRLMNKNYYSANIKFHFIYSPQSYLKMFFLTLNPFTYLKIIKTITDIKPDIIHVAVPFLWVALILPFLRKYPIVVTEHEPTLHFGTLAVVKLYMNMSIWLTRKFADAVIVHGKRMKDIVVQAGVVERKVSIVPHGEFSFYKQWESSEVKENKTILFFGKVTEYKGLQYFVDACPLIAAKIPEARFIIAGSGDIERYLPLEKRSDYFEVHNDFIPDEKVAQYFQKAAVVVLPYIDGTQSGVIPIAYSFGKPVVVTDVGSIAEAVDQGKTGFIVPPRDIESLAQALVILLNNDELRKQMGRNALEKINGELSWDNIAKKTLQVYEEIIHTHNESRELVDAKC